MIGIIAFSDILLCRLNVAKKGGKKAALKQQTLSFAAPAATTSSVGGAEITPPTAPVEGIPAAGIFKTSVVNAITDVTEPASGTHEGRLVTVELDAFFLVNVYVPNSGDGLARLTYRTETWDPFLRSYMQSLSQKKPVILTGDLNVAHLDIDIYNAGAKHIAKIAGLTPQERSSFGVWLNGAANEGSENENKEGRVVDVLRAFHPGKTSMR